MLLLFARVAEPGRVKTRLIPRLGALGAAEVYRRMAGEVAREAAGLSRAGLVRACLIEPSERLDEARAWLPGAFEVLPQAQGDLGRKLEAAFAWAFARGAQRAIAIGTDCLDLRARHLEEAFEALGGHGAVLGPAVDGGYYLIGLGRELGPRLAEVFEGVPWSTGEVLASTRRRLDALGAACRLLEPLRDLDTPEDLEALLPRWGRTLGLT